ncbi:MAG: hypothetical protein AAB340_03525 [Patescibacteria group bacterium]
MNNFSETNAKPLIFYVVNSQLFTDNPSYLLIILFIELIGVVGLLIISIKSRKKFFTIIFGIILVWLCFLFFLGYVFSTMRLGL